MVFQKQTNLSQFLLVRKVKKNIKHYILDQKTISKKRNTIKLKSFGKQK